MPHLKVDPGAFDEWAENLGSEVDLGNRPTGDWEYESAEAQFKPAKLGPVARAMLDALLAARATAFRVRYDGGYDEGFSHPDTLTFGEGGGRTIRPADAVIKDLATPALAAQIRTAMSKDKSWKHSAETYATSKDADVVHAALDDLAHTFASRLLGDGFGTGEYQLYGAFTADLKTGQIVDHEDAEKPSELE